MSPRPSSWSKKGRQEDDISRDDPEFEKNNLSLSLSVGSDVFPRGNILRDPEVSFSPRVCPSARHVGIVLPAKVKLSRTRCVFLYFRSVNGHRRYPGPKFRVKHFLVLLLLSLLARRNLIAIVSFFFLYDTFGYSSGNLIRIR